MPIRAVADMVAEAYSEIVTMQMDETESRIGDDDTVIVDIRDVRELQRSGKIPGAFHCPRGMLEFWIDPISPYHKDIFAKDKTFVFYCAGAQRSALAAKTAQDMGLEKVAHMAGGFSAWEEAGKPVEDVIRK